MVTLEFMCLIFMVKLFGAFDKSDAYSKTRGPDRNARGWY